MEVTDKQLIRALRCSGRTPPKVGECEGCYYSLIEDWDGEKIRSCDCDRMVMDAAARLEELTGAAGETGDGSG